MRDCPNCGTPRPDTGPCAECNRQKVAAWYRANREHRAAYMREYRRRKAQERWAS